MIKESRPKHREKSSVSRRRLKADSDVDEVTLDGRLFHTREAAATSSRLFYTALSVSTVKHQDHPTDGLTPSMNCSELGGRTNTDATQIYIKK